MNERTGWSFACVAIGAAVVMALAASLVEAQDGAGDRIPQASKAELQRFRAAARENVAAAEGGDRLVVEGSDGWLFLRNELHHVGAGQFWGEPAAEVSKARRAAWADPMPAIVDFNERLERQGIELLFVPVPPKAMVYPDKLMAEAPMTEAGLPKRLDRAHRRFYAKLREQGVSVLNVTDLLIAARGRLDERLYCKTDTHYSPTACRVIAEHVAAEVSDRDWLNGIETAELATQSTTVTIDGDLRRMMDEPTVGQETLAARLVGTKGGGSIAPLKPKRDSPVLLLGDSHTLVFHSGGDLHMRGAGLVDQLSYELGFGLDLLGVRGSGATQSRISLFRRGRGNADYIKNKKLIIWVMTTREFTEGRGWREVPVLRP